MDYYNFDGKKIDTSEISHQHLSNIYWYQRVVFGIHPHSIIMNRIRNDFGGLILDYKPNPKFREELEYLEKMNMLSWKVVDGKRVADIMWRGNIIGEASYIEDVREDIINQIIK